MSWLTDNIRWVQSITLEGDRLTADDIVVHRDMIAGARIDSFGIRPSFVACLALLLGAIGLSVVAFVDTLQFFQPNYTVFGLSLVPIIVLGYLTLRLRPTQHFTVLLRDGSALGVRSRDGSFLTRSLEAFERLWADKNASQSSLYLHAVHRSADLGPPTGGIDVIANARHDGDDLVPPLPLFEQNEDEDEDDAGKSSDDVIKLPDLPPPPLDDEPSDEDKPDDDVAPEAADRTEVTDEASVFPPPLPARFDETSEDDKDDAVEADDTEKVSDAEDPDLAAADNGVAEEPSRQPPVENVPAEQFAEVRPKVEALVKLLRERAPAQDIGDAVDVLELMTRRGCANPVEVRALSRAIDLLCDRMKAYPTAVELLERVALEGKLPPVTSAESEPAKPDDG